MTTEEILHKPDDPDKKQVFKRLQSYFRADEQGKLKEYHDKREKRLEWKRNKKYKDKQNKNKKLEV